MNIEIESITHDHPIEEMFDVLKSAFEEHRQQGIYFSCMSFNLDDFKKEEASTSTVIVARDTSKNKIVGFQNVWVSRGGRAVGGLIAVHSCYKRSGVGSMLFKKTQEYAIDKDASYILSNTAVGAKSSINWHLKNGFKIVGLKSWSDTNYYTYVFRKQLVYHPLWSNSLYCQVHYWLSALKCRLCFRENGEQRALMKVYLSIRAKMVN